MNITDKQLRALMEYTVNTASAVQDYRLHGKSAERARDALCAAFGFVVGPDSWPMVPQAAPTAPKTDETPRGSARDALVYKVADLFGLWTWRMEAAGRILDNWDALCDTMPLPKSHPYMRPARGPTTEHQQAEADADHDNKHEAIVALLTSRDADMHTSMGADEIMRLWPELKAIMEPEHCSCNICLRPIGHEPVPGEVCPGCGWRMRMTD